MKNAVILLTAGRGTRMRGKIQDKVLAPLNGVPVFAYSLAAFRESGTVRDYIIVNRDDAQESALKSIVDPLHGFDGEGHLSYIRGGAERQQSVQSGLMALREDIETVFIHDCARPLIKPEMLKKLLRIVRRDGAVSLAHKVTDTIKRVSEDTVPGQPGIIEDLERESLWGMETPQVFSRDLIMRAYREIARTGTSITDDTAAVTLLSHPVTIVENPYPNPKLTRPDDFTLAAFYLKQ